MEALDSTRLDSTGRLPSRLHKRRWRKPPYPRILVWETCIARSLSYPSKNLPRCQALPQIRRRKPAATTLQRRNHRVHLQHPRGGHPRERRQRWRRQSVGRGQTASAGALPSTCSARGEVAAGLPGTPGHRPGAARLGRRRRGRWRCKTGQRGILPSWTTGIMPLLSCGLQDLVRRRSAACNLPA
jgi:hypothetical protein